MFLTNTDDLQYNDFINRVADDIEDENINVALSVDNGEFEMSMHFQFDSDMSTLCVEYAKLYQNTFHVQRTFYGRVSFRIDDDFSIKDALKTFLYEQFNVNDTASLRAIRVNVHTPDELRQMLLLQPFGVYNDGYSIRFYFIDKRDRLTTTLTHRLRVHTIDASSHEILSASYACELV